MCLFLGTFFLPLGYDILIKVLLDLGITYWHIMYIFYLLSACFFGLFFYFSGVSPKKFILEIFGKIKNVVGKWI